ncbi:MAG: hypothetical protein ACPG43_02565 [Alcanivoracaceae bacterium]
MKAFTYLLLSCLLALPVAASAEVVVVASDSLGITSLNQADVRLIFSGKRSNVDGVAVVPLDLPADAPAREVFYRKVLEKSASQMRSHWARLTFTGRGNPPKIVSGEDELAILLSSSSRNYIGYMDAAMVRPGMVILYRAE